MYWYNEVNKLPSQPRKMTQKEKLDNYKCVLEQINDTIQIAIESNVKDKYPKAIGLIQGILTDVDSPVYETTKHTHEEIKKLLEED